MAPQFPPAILNPEIKYRQLFINNQFVPAKDGTTFSVESPITGEEICQVSRAKKADVDAAVAAAKKAYSPGSEWRTMNPKTRALYLNKLADLIDRDRHYIASLESLDCGRHYVTILAGDIQMCIETLRYFAGWCDKDHGKTIPYDKDHFCFTRHEPMGVCGAITPWNVPMIIFFWKLAPCLATGNVLVAKPSELTPLTALYVASLVKEAGFPPGVVNVIPGYGMEAGEALSRHMDVNKIAFTGSGVTGRKIQIAAAESNLKRVSLELGGKSPNIIFSDVNLDYAIQMAHTAIFSNNGQVCCAGSRTFVHEDIYDEFVKRSVKRAQEGQMGDPREFATEHGPQVSKVQKDKILGLLQSGKDQGATVLCGGGSVEDRKGYYVQPTVLTNLKDDMTVSKEEIFGPVQQIYKFKDVSEVIERANNTAYGLAAAVFTNDINKAMEIANSVEAGTVWVNCFFDMNPTAPFGGYKASGIGRDLSEYALREYTQVKVVTIKLNTPSL
ncbi:aldehyde dehydrogenase, mitochondrial-like [Clavelina lepadiformis]|uniref:Aldehyde dehydrogenase domain-containing protein n=1 Tax=Clavelina lepadiformis TaxID=159417 RepID=A0ABP0H477_CLALP